MNEIDLENLHPKPEHFDIVTVPQTLLCWGFDTRNMMDAYGIGFELTVFRALLTGLKEISESKNRRVRKRQFVILGGFYLWDTYWIGVPANIYADVAFILVRHFQRLAGYETQDYGDISYLHFSVLFKYDHGRVIEYSDVSDAGMECLDAYESGMKVYYRLT